MKWDQQQIRHWRRKYQWNEDITILTFQMKDKREENTENEVESEHSIWKNNGWNFPNLIKILNSQSNSMSPKQEKLEEKTCQDT